MERLTDCLDMIIDVGWDVIPKIKQSSRQHWQTKFSLGKGIFEGQIHLLRKGLNTVPFCESVAQDFV